jgi:fructokinase
VKAIDIICIGEILIDFIGQDLNLGIEETNSYQRFLGGSPTNVAINAAHLGMKSVLVASCGNDGLGDFMIKKLHESKVDSTSIYQSEILPTSVIFVSKSTETPDFIAYREADFHIMVSQLPDEVIAKAKIFHTTAFGLSRNPARQTILNRAKKAKQLGLQLSIDINFSEKIWPDREEAKKVLTEYLFYDPLVKLSEDDCTRFFGKEKSEDSIFNYFHELGAQTICYTKGKDGVTVSCKKEGMLFQKATIIKEVKDATGAGDAFWTGFLYAKLQGHTIENCLTIAQKLAALKLQNIGGLPQDVDYKEYLKIKK